MGHVSAASSPNARPNNSAHDTVLKTAFSKEKEVSPRLNCERVRSIDTKGTELSTGRKVRSHIVYILTRERDAKMLRRLGLRRMSSRTEKEPKSLLDLLDVLKIWELSKQGIAAWAVAGTIGYVLYIRPKMYPKIEYEQARTFTPKEVEEWNKAMDAKKSR